MKKIITVFAVIALSTVSAKAVDLTAFSLTAGLANNMSVWGGTAKESNNDEAGALKTVVEEHGVFADSYNSYLLELGIGRFVSLGYEMAQDSIETPENVAHEDKASEKKVSVDFNDFETTYIKLNIPGGAYVKYGSVSAIVDITVTGGDSTNTYADTTTSGTSMGAGYQRYFGDSGFGFRFEANYIDLDNVTVNNGVTTASTANGGENKIETKNLEGATAKLALTYTLGREGN